MMMMMMTLLSTNTSNTSCNNNTVQIPVYTHTTCAATRCVARRTTPSTTDNVYNNQNVIIGRDLRNQQRSCPEIFFITVRMDHEYPTVMSTRQMLHSHFAFTGVDNLCYYYFLVYNDWSAQIRPRHAVAEGPTLATCT